MGRQCLCLTPRNRDLLLSPELLQSTAGEPWSVWPCSCWAAAGSMPDVVFIAASESSWRTWSACSDTPQAGSILRSLCCWVFLREKETFTGILQGFISLPPQS